MKKIFYLLSVLLLLFISCNNNEKSSTQAEQKTVSGYDTDGMLLVDGKRTFIIGSYHLPKTDTPFITLKENGFNYVRVAADKSQLEQAEKNSLHVWISTGAIRSEAEQEDSDKIKKIITEYKESPALLNWEIADEPAFTWKSAEMRIKPQAMIKTYNLIKSIDKKHLIYTNHGPVNLISTLQKYNPATDITAVDVYPVIPHGITPTYALYDDGLQGDLLNPYISQVGEYAERLKRVSAEKPFFMVQQGFAWEMLKPRSERNPQMILYPSYEQLRFMAFNAIIHGANGIIYWGTKYCPANEPFWNDLFKVTRELDSMQDILTAPVEDFPIEKEYHELGFSVDGGVEVLIKQLNGSVYLLTANEDKHPAKISFNNILGFTKAEVLSENREILINGETFTENYKPFQVHIYKLTN